MRYRCSFFFLACSLILLSAYARADVPAEILERGKRATALVEIPGEGYGSAFCIQNTGLFVTNAHVVEAKRADKSVLLVLNPGESDQKTVTATVLRKDASSDLALLQVETPVNLPVLSLGDSDLLKETMAVTAFGYPFGKDLAVTKDSYPSITVSTGHITALRKTRGQLAEIQLDAVLNPGNSGGPVLNEKGQVIGIVRAGILGSGVNFAIPVSWLKPLISGVTILFTPPTIPLGQQNQEKEFVIQVVTPGRTLTDLSVTLTLTPQNGMKRSYQATADRSQTFRVKAVPIPLPANGRQQPADKPQETDVPPVIEYEIVVRQGGKTLAETDGVLIVGQEVGAQVKPGRRRAKNGKGVISFTAAVLCGAEASGKYDGWDYWSTGAGPASRLWFQQDGEWLSADDGAIDIDLTPGLHTFRFYAEPVNSFTRFGLNLFFDHNDMTPGISAFVLGANSRTLQPAFQPTHESTMRPDTGGVQGSGTLSYSRGDVTVEMIQFHVELPSVQKLDPVTRNEIAPDGVPDLVGTLTLRVTLRHKQ